MSGFANFLKQLDLILQKLYNNKYNTLMCGDVNVNYLIDNNRRSQIDAVLHSYNLASIAEFPTRYGLNSQTAMTMFSLTHPPLEKCDLYSPIHGLSDHDTQLLILNKGQKVKKKVVLI